MLSDGEKMTAVGGHRPPLQLSHEREQIRKIAESFRGSEVQEFSIRIQKARKLNPSPLWFYGFQIQPSAWRPLLADLREADDESGKQEEEAEIEFGNHETRKEPAGIEPAGSGAGWTWLKAEHRDVRIKPYDIAEAA